MTEENKNGFYDELLKGSVTTINTQEDDAIVGSVFAGRPEDDEDDEDDDSSGYTLISASPERSNTFDEIDYGINIDDSIIYLHGDISMGTLFDLIAKTRIILKNRPEEDADKPITILLNSNGGDVYEANGMVDYIESLDVKVNIIARGRALSAAALLLCSATGLRAASKSTVIMIHESSAEFAGRSSDIKANADHIDELETIFYKRLEELSNQNEDFWRKSCRKDFYMTAEKALELGLIDKVI